MNFSAYDIVDKCYYKGTWARSSYQRLYSSQIPYRRYYCWLKRYNLKEKYNEYFLALYDEDKYDDILCSQTMINKHGSIKVSLSSIWDDIKDKFNNEELLQDISVTKEDEYDDGCIYRIEF